MEYKELICIRCPIGCMLNVELENGEVKKVKGNSCPRGEQYALKEVTNPTRIVTSTVKVTNGNHPVVSVKTSSDIPKDKIKDCIAVIKDIKIAAPVNIGEVIVKNAVGTDSNIIATKNIEASRKIADSTEVFA
ncbi:MAG: DUF1667 domain-containing protein [Herbinix sp.]|nr:DUF1667 domain-containing protein [Herbinix sp.]